MTRVLAYSDESIAEAARLIAAGQPVAVPTETVYGLAGDATSDASVAAIYAAKGRPSFNPLIVHVRDLAHARTLAVFDADAEKLAAAHWPGPLTLVLPVRGDAGLAKAVTAGLPTVAIRVPAHRAMQSLLAATGKPLAAPSANASGGISPTRAEHVLRSLGGRIPMAIDDGATSGGIESTIVAVGDGQVRLLRPGPVVIDDAVANSKAKIEAPGQLAAHYAPAKRLRIDAQTANVDEWHIGFGSIPGDATLSATGSLSEAASRLFDMLHQADTQHRPRIAIAPVPDTGIGMAINDRLRRAAVGSGGRA
ncbi:L-threonylcarbamoyladenylate synthase [Sphingomonas sp. SUN039]|uniref:L-threonylcarbamoyladenylate synthase n=1 Tax=Sphingomonas sp. SUN039 TaxID=2937787 RepID=UPI002164DD9C|nr:L-threonylcarbamoyladenylate synthase [Sphingomonas sp. SUN039]UVO52870.1 L-threonylcarbamoyladenylate synthase [Sphingomonas sp. SUN039]